MARLELDRVSKRYGDVDAVRDVSLDVDKVGVDAEHGGGTDAGEHTQCSPAAAKRLHQMLA